MPTDGIEPPTLASSGQRSTDELSRLQNVPHPSSDVRGFSGPSQHYWVLNPMLSLEHKDVDYYKFARTSNALV